MSFLSKFRYSKYLTHILKCRIRILILYPHSLCFRVIKDILDLLRRKQVLDILRDTCRNSAPFTETLPYLSGIFRSLLLFQKQILAIAIVAILGSGMTNVVIAVAVFSTPTFARLVRSKTLSLKNSVFVLAARNIGVSDARILFHHILPGAIPDIIVQYIETYNSESDEIARLLL